MKEQFLYTDYLFLGDGNVIKNGFVSIDPSGKINSIGRVNDNVIKIGSYFKGGLCPSFINSHCHLELSHLKNQIAEKKGLVPFIKELQSIRKGNLNSIENTIQEADRLMWKEGISAVGDISNSEISFQTKKKSKIKYHTFIELFGFDETRAEEIINNGKSLISKIGTSNSSIVPHSPYSVSRKLMQLIFEQSKIKIKSIHNQESASENKMYMDGNGDLMAMLKTFNIETKSFSPSGKSSLTSYLNQVPSETPLLLVHNTFSSNDDIDQASKLHKKLFWGLCPKANLFIEDTLPPIDLFYKKSLKCTIGTDSLASNDNLSILEELKTIHKAFPKIPLKTLILWACKNGAEALQFNGLGVLEKGKLPGINQICELTKDGQLTEDSSVKRIF